MMRRQFTLNLRGNRSVCINGFGLTEALVALSAGTVIVGTGAMALKATGSLIDQSSSKAVLRQNTTNGMRLVRSEVERSLHLIVNADSQIIPQDKDFSLGSSRYSNLISHCEAQAPGGAFLPIFGVKMASTELIEPVIYGYGISPRSGAYSLMRCGAPMDKIGAYIENTEDSRKEFVSVVIDNIGIKGCAVDQSGNHLDDICDETNEEKQKAKDDYDIKPLIEILNDMQNASKNQDGLLFSDDDEGGLSTPIVSYRQPALRVQTDTTLKLVKFIDPNPKDVASKSSYLQTSRNGRTATTSPLYLAAFARADKRLGQYGSEDGLQNITIFQDITSKNVRFVLDGSGSMSACIIWSEEKSKNDRKFWLPGKGYIWTDQICLLTRMETLIQELYTMIGALPNETNLGLEMFSSDGWDNHNNIWSPSKRGLVRIGDDGVRDSALEWVVSLDDVSNVGRWGGTEPWPAMNRAFNDEQADTIYLLSDGVPNRFSNKVFPWNVDTPDEVIDFYTEENSKRSKKLQVHTIALGLKSDWMKKLSDSNQGDYMQYDSSTLAEVN